MMHGRKTGFALKLFKSAGIWGLASMLAIVMEKSGIRIENILLIYLVGVMISSVETGSLGWGIGSAITAVFTFNFLFTEPKYTLRVNDANYLISFIVFIVVALVVTSLVTKLQDQMKIANTKTEITSKLSIIGNGFLNLSGYLAIKMYGQESLYHLTGREMNVLIKETADEEFEDSMAEWCFRHSMTCGHEEAQFSNAGNLYIPIMNSRKTYGVLCFDCKSKSMGKEEKLYIETVITQLTLVLERERLSQEKEEGKLQVERERLKSTLLRSISHDLRTPLTSIAGGSGFLCENFSELDSETIRNMLTDINKDAEWMSSLVENLLNMTRIQEGKLQVSKKMEVVDDIVSAAIGIVAKRTGEHKLNTETPEEVTLFPVDGRLFTQVLVNLLDNAFRHSGKNTIVKLSAVITGKHIIFRVADNGRGIPTDKMNDIFDNFFTTAYENGDRQRGVGLGLAICKAIVQAHGGTLQAYNNEKGGATFQVELPMEDK